MGGDKGCNTFWGQRLANICSFVGGRIIVQKKNLDSRTQLDGPVEWASGGDPLLLYKILHLLFFPPVRILRALHLERKKISTWSWCGTFGISVSSAEGMSYKPIQNYVALFRGHRQNTKTPGLISRNNFVKNILSALAIAIMSWQDVTRSSLCSGVKECGTKRAHNFLFPKSSFRIRRTTVLAMFKVSVIILDAIRRSFLTKSATAAMFTSVRVDFGRPPLSSSSTSSLPSRNREYHLRTFDGFRAPFS